MLRRALRHRPMASEHIDLKQAPRTPSGLLSVNPCTGRGPPISTDRRRGQLVATATREDTNPRGICILKEFGRYDQLDMVRASKISVCNTPVVLIGHSNRLAVSNMNHYRPSAPFHTGTPANLQRPQFDNWSAKKKSSLGLFGTSSSVVYWGDLKERDEKMKAMRLKYDMNESRRELVREAFHKLDHDGDGLVTIDDLRNKGYNAKSHPRYSAEGVNHWSEDQIYLSVLARFKGGVYEPGTTVKYQDLRLEEFEEYYRIVGEDLDDEYFEAMMIQAWRIQRKNPGFQGYDNRILSQLALVEANMLQDKYFGQDELNRSKLEAVQIDSEQQAKLDSWKSMIQSGDFNKMNKAAEEIEIWVKVEDKMKEFSRPVPANAIRFFRSGGADMLTELACAQDAIIKRTCANVLFWALKPELAQLELAKDSKGKTRLIRDGLPAIAQGSDAVARNKVERVKSMIM
uniref:EF-hand domain-containing protein n=1 Tax=Guillardia theta TaxID=55529 RepID=A0A7S4H991_GUITH|mmetsp:Transcript_11196/g.38121  ORF Transcript_11196/g.38121 Transcript_11196/m.38121 type:complete len:458 (+) Transcript_11196:87-1460(+)